MTPRPPPGPGGRPAGSRRVCCVGTSTWDRLTAAGLTPAPIRLGGSVAWSRRELTVWIDYGCPPRAEWEPVWRTLRTARRTK